MLPCWGVGGGNAARQVVDGLWTEARGQQKQSNDPCNNQHNPRYANYRAPLTRKRHIPPHSAQPRYTNHWAPPTRKRHQREHRPQRPTERSDPTQHAKGRAGDCPGPRKGATTRRNVTRGGGGASIEPPENWGGWVWEKGPMEARQSSQSILCPTRLGGVGTGLRNVQCPCTHRCSRGRVGRRR